MVIFSTIAPDRALFLFFNRTIANPVFDGLFPVITDGRFWILPALLAAYIFIRVEKKNAFIVLGLMLLTVAISDPLCNQIIKPFFHRLRPCNPQALVEGGRFLLGYRGSFSFPSSHAMNMFAQAMLLALWYPKQWLWFFLFASIIGFSRIYVGMHYPLDVAAGALFGIAIGAGVFATYRIIKRKIDGKKRTIIDVSVME